MSLLVLGTVALDHVKTPSGNKKDLLGGSAAHFAMAARLFTKVHMVGIIGWDFPTRHLNYLKKKEIDIASLKKTSGKSFRWMGEYKKENLNQALTLKTELGVLADYDPWIAARQQSLKDIFLANIDPDMQMNLLQKLKKVHFVGCDSMNLWIHHKRKSLKKLLKKVDLFVVNDQEARDLSGEMNLIKAAKLLRKMGPSLIVIKKGEHGVYFYCDRFHFSYPAYPIEKVIDPTGAGDTFAGGLMGYLTKVKKHNNPSLKKAVLYATTVASFNVEGFGLSRTSRLSMARVNRRLKEYQQFISF